MKPTTSLALLGTGAVLVWSGLTNQDVFAAVAKVVSGKLAGSATPGGLVGLQPGQTGRDLTTPTSPIPSGGKVPIPPGYIGPHL